jgi:hypothetical protein
MSVTRRIFLKSGAMSVLAASFLIKSADFAFGQNSGQGNPAVDFPIPYEAKQAPTFYYTRATFEPYVGGVFQTRGVGGHTVDMTLANIRSCEPNTTDLKVTKKWRRSNCFVLNFRSPEQLSDLTNIYKLRHGALGEFDLFLTRRGTTSDGILYEAVFNQVIP